MNQKKTFLFNDKEVSITTGYYANQANGVLLECGDTTILAATVIDEAISQNNYLPLTVKYRERMYAAGKIPGGFFKRELKPTDKEILCERIVDRSFRPLFPDHFRHETQIVLTLLSYDNTIDLDSLLILATSISLSLARSPLTSHVAGLKISNDTLNLLVVSGSKGLLMLEGSADDIAEDIILSHIKKANILIQNFLPTLEEHFPLNPRIIPHLSDLPEVNEIVLTEINNRLAEVKYNINELKLEDLVEEALSLNLLKEVSENIFKQHLKNNILSGKPRLDGRNTRKIRDIDIQSALLKKCHGSAVFTRGKTQVLAAVTVGGTGCAQILEGVELEQRNFILHYNFPAFCVGEVGNYSSPKRREIGHGNLAYQAFKYCIPSDSYTVRAVAEVLESDGSSSQACICAVSLALMSAGIPMTKHIAGVAMGIIQNHERFAVLSDICELEDHFGDADCKIAGSATGITAIQMDIKFDGMGLDMLEALLNQAQQARSHILEIMHTAVPQGNKQINLSNISQITISVKQIKLLIGRNGINIKSIIEKTRADIDINQDTGVVNIIAPCSEDLQLAIKLIQQSVESEPEIQVQVGQQFRATVMKTLIKGSFLRLMPGVDGYLPSNDFEVGHQLNVEVEKIGMKGRPQLKII